MVIKSRMFCAFSCVVLGYVALASGQQPPRPADETEQTKATTSEATIPAPPSSRAAESLLRKRVEAVDWTDKTFEEVLDWLRDSGDDRVNIVPKWGPLGVENVNRESLVTLQLNNTTVADVLIEALDQLSEDGEIRYRGIDNKLTISTRQDFERKHHVRIYNATDLLFRIPDFGQGAPIIDLQRTARGGGGGSGGGGGGGQSVFGGGSGGGQSGSQDNESGQQAEQLIEQRLTKLKELIQRTIAPETWDLTGTQGTSAQAAGGRGRIEVYSRSLVISNTIEVHEEIAGAFSFE